MVTILAGIISPSLLPKTRRKQLPIRQKNS